MMNANIERLAIGGGAVVLGLVLGWMGRGLITYNTGQESSTPYSDWRTVCPAATTKDASCEMIADVADPKTKQVAARVSISRDAKLGQVFAVVVPLNVLLDPGLGLQVGKDPVRQYKYRTCNQAGCLSVTPIDDALVTEMSGADKLQLMTISANPGSTMQTLDISRKGFADARKAYLNGNRKRSSWFWRVF
jgi:invasion protein IalB